MTFPNIQPSLASGEISPQAWGRIDLEQIHSGAATLRNMFVNYRGGASSRGGTLFCGLSLQPGTSYPPRLINFQFNINQGYALEFGDLYMRVISEGAYVLETAIDITAATQAAQVELTTSGVHGFAVGDWVYVADVEGMTELNGKTYKVADVPTTTTLTLDTVFDDPVNSTDYTAYTSGGTIARVYTLTTPYAAEDLPYLKFAQSADVMSFTHPDYPTYDLTRLAANNWSLDEATFGVSISAPAAPTVTATVTTATGPTEYAYVATAVDRITGEESLPSARASVTNSVNMSLTAGAIYVRVPSVTGAGSYNIYRGPVGYSASVPLGSIFGYVGSCLGGFFVDGNTIADLTKTPPQYENPFAPGAVLAVTLTAAGTGYTSTPTATITSATGSGASLQVVTDLPLSGVVRAIYVVNPGSGYADGDTVSISGGGGSGATATLIIGPATGTYPSVVAYFQQRRVYANTLNNPDTYYMTQVGAFTNFSSGFIPSGSDAIIGTPWAQQVNGIQALVPMPGGLVALTGLGAWQISGSGGPAQPITPTDQSAQPQAFNGCHDHIPPIVINFDILYVQAKGYIVRDLAYDFLVNIYTGTDITVLSNHLFEGYELVEWAWADEPYKLIWAVRNDGGLLSLAYIKEQKVNGWTRHDTRGLFKSICSVTEPPVNAIYVVVQRYLHNAWHYCIERMDNRLWTSVEDTWAVDCGLALPQPAPDATLIALTASGDGGILSIAPLNFGSGYTTATVTIEDPTGTGAEAVANIDGSGRITSIDVTAVGTGYTDPTVTISGDGEDATALATLGHFATFEADASVFSGDNIGDIIRIGGGKARVVSVPSATQVYVDILSPILAVVQNSDGDLPVPALSGEWTMTTPTTSVSGLDHLEGLEVACLADGSVINGLTVEDGQITLPQAASSIVVGLGFIAQLQSLNLDINASITVQGKRKNIQALTMRVARSRGLKAGTNQPNASTAQPILHNVPWDNLVEVKERGNDVFAGDAIPLFTGDYKVNIKGVWEKPGQVALQQEYPLPFNCLALIPEFTIGDTSG